MSDNELARNLAVENRRRLVASIMEHAEKSPWWPRLSREDKEAFRAKVLDSVGRYHDFVLDILRVNARTGVQSDEVMEILRKMWDHMRVVERELAHD